MADNHHHLVCRSCGRTVEISLPGLEEQTRKIAGQYGFAEIDHEVEFFGTCADCSK